MKLLIDECLSPDLAQIAWDTNLECMHVTRIGLGSMEDWQLVRVAVTEDWVLVTNNTADFVELVGREEVHPGLVCLNFTPDEMGADSQRRLFGHALAQLAGRDPMNEILDVTLRSDRVVQTKRYVWPSAALGTESSRQSSS